MSSFYHMKGPDTDPLAPANEKTRQFLPQAVCQLSSGISWILVREPMIHSRCAARQILSSVQRDAESQTEVGQQSKTLLHGLSNLGKKGNLAVCLVT